MESALQKNIWVKNAQLFFDNNEKLQVNVLEREPVARVFTTMGTTFYVDSSRAMLPLSDKFSARLPVFTGFPSDKKVLLKADSNLLKDILTISMAIQEDSFHMAMIEQVDITPERSFEMVPKFGNTIIVFGDAKNAKEKLEKLRIFYKEVMVKAGWNKYSEINVQYLNQVVAKRKGADEFKADSLHTLQIMQAIAENAERMASDSLSTIMQDNERNTTNNSIIQESIERDDNNSTTNTNEEPQPQGVNSNEKPTSINPAPVTISKPGATVGTKPAAVAKKPGTVKQPVNIEKPKPAETKTGTVKQPVNNEKPKPVETKTPKLVMPKAIPKNTGERSLLMSTRGPGPKGRCGKCKII
jgi:cell division protein FtsQ